MYGCPTLSALETNRLPVVLNAISVLKTWPFLYANLPLGSHKIDGCNGRVHYIQRVT